MKVKYVGATQFVTSRGVLLPGRILEVSSQDKDVAFFEDGLKKGLFKVVLDKPEPEKVEETKSDKTEKADEKVDEKAAEKADEEKTEIPDAVSDLKPESSAGDVLKNVFGKKKGKGRK